MLLSISVRRWLATILMSCTLMHARCGQAQEEQSFVHVDTASKVFRIDAGAMTYAFGVNEHAELQSLYWGPRLAPEDHLGPARSAPGISSFDLAVNTTPQEFAGWGEGLYIEPDLKITFPDGNRDLALRYQSYSIRNHLLSVVMKDVERDIYVTLQYEPDPATGILRRQALIENRTSTPVVVEQASASTWNLPRGKDYVLRYLTGRWAGEGSIQEQLVQPGKTILESRRGSTGVQNAPWFAVRRRDTNEEHGEVWFGSLAWSGSWQIAIEQDQVQNVRITGGFNPFDFGYLLPPGQRLETPSFYAGVTLDGMGEASRLMHRLELDTILPRSSAPRPRPVLYNSWEATQFSVTEAGQMALAEKAASIGVERFVVDDGWFGERSNDHAGLGDWMVNPQKFPHGLKPLIDRVHALGMDFGLWVEPEMVNPDSELYRNHPDWVLNMTGRPRTEARHQLVLNLARPDVRAYVYSVLDKLLSENDIAFLKWDYNRNWSEPGWPSVAPEAQKNVYVDFTRNLYSILEELRHRHPHVEIESCSGGGGRVDLGILHYTDEVWPSDNTDAFDRLQIQNGFTQAYTPGIMMAWVTDSPTWVNQRSLSLSYRFLSAMQGSLGIGSDLNKWAPQDFATAREMIATYKSIRDIVQHGDLYRLLSPANGSEQSATENVSHDHAHAVLFAFLHSSTELYPYPRVYLEGLDEQAMYRVSAISGSAIKDTPQIASGAYWMHHGIDIQLRGDFQAAAFHFDRQ